MCNTEYVPKENPRAAPSTTDEGRAVEQIDRKRQWRCLLCDTVNDLTEEERQTCGQHAVDPSSFKSGAATEITKAAPQSCCKLCDTPRIVNKEIKRHMKIVLQTR